MMYLFIIGGLIVGGILAMICPFDIPMAYSHYTSVALLAASDAVFGGSRAALERTFDLKSFMTGFFANSILAVLLVFIGDKVDIDLYYVALIGFGLRVFMNTAAIRRIIMSKRR